MDSRERAVVGALALSFVAAAGLVASYVPAQREADPLLIGLLVALYAAISRVEFEIGDGYAVPEQLVLVPMLFLVPISTVPILVALAFVIAAIPDFVKGRLHVERSLMCLGDAWPTIGPVLVIAYLAPGEPRLEQVEFYTLAVVAQVAIGVAMALLRDRRLADFSPGHSLRSALWAYRIDVVLSPVALLIAIVAVDTPFALLAIAPLVWLLSVFSRERKERYAAAIELTRVYRGTVMLLADVVEAEDDYTADHCRGVVELVDAVAEEMGIDEETRRELEIAALLHDVGKIAIPNEILTKPAALTKEEFDLMKTHTIEGQALLNKVGGQLARVGELVRWSHERWDGDGYPDRLAGDEIPLPSRIVFACDAWSAMTTNRPYRAAMGREQAMEELWRNAGTQFDPRVVAALSNVVTEGLHEDSRTYADAVRAVLASRQVAGPVEGAA
jgi:HD-GYP domain-containing protein (c-di-GMP phosphodiesterase class II)